MLGVAFSADEVDSPLAEMEEHVPSGALLHLRSYALVIQSLVWHEWFEWG